MLFRRKARAALAERLRVALWPRRSFSRSFAYYKHRVLRLEATPHAIAAGVAAGAFASCTPFIGFHFILAFVFAWIIGGSLVAAAFGTAVGNPLTFPVIWLTTFQIGQVILGPVDGAVSPRRIEFSFDLLWNSFATLWPTLKPMLVGGLVLGLFVGGLTYAMVRSAVMVSRSLRQARLAAAAEARMKRAREAADGAGCDKGSVSPSSPSSPSMADGKSPS